MNPNWFETSQVADNIFLTNETKFFEGNRSNIWLIKGSGKDVIIDTGLGVCNLKTHLEKQGLLTPDKPCDVIVTHAHFDHSGGAHHFQKVFAHRDDQPGISRGRQTDTLNYVYSSHFYEEPYPGFSACRYRVPPTPCQGLNDGDCIDIGGGEELQIIHTPGHTKGSLCVWYSAKECLFTGDFLYDCGFGGFLLDWLPTSSVASYTKSATEMLDFIGNHNVAKLYPGHFRTFDASRACGLLNQYIEDKEGCGKTCSATCMQCTTYWFFLSNCFRCCSCCS